MKKITPRFKSLFLLFLLLQACSEGPTNEERLRSAQVNYAQGDFGTATIELRNILQADSQYADARLLLGQIYLASGDYADAVKELGLASQFGGSDEHVLPPLSRALVEVGDFDELQSIDIANLSSEGQARVLAAKAQGMIRAGEYVEARMALNTALELAPELVYPRIVYARYHLEGDHRDTTLARKYLEEALEISPGSALVWRMLGDREYEDGAMEKAAEAYRTAIQHDTTSAIAHVRLADIEIHLGRYEAAEQVIKELAVLAPGHSGLIYVRALKAFRQLELEQAQDLFAQSLIGAEVYGMAYYYGGATEFLLGNTGAAENYLNQFNIIYPGHIAGRKLYSVILISSGRFSEAENLMQPVVDFNGEDVEALNILANALMKQGKTDEGLPILLRLVELEPDSAEAQARLGSGLVQGGEDLAGMQRIKAAMELDPDYVAADVLLVFNHLRLEEFDEALAVAEAYRLKKPDFPGPYRTLGATYLAMGNSAKAQSVLLEARALEAGDPYTGHELARIAVSEGRLEEARTYYLEILQTHADYLPTLMNLASLSAVTGDQAGMLSYLDRAARTHPQAIEPRLVLARYYLLEGKPDQVGALFAGLERQVKDNAGYLELAARAALEQRNFAEAQSLSEQYVEMHPESGIAHFLLARSLAGSPGGKSMVAELETALSLQPDLVEARIALAKYLLATQQHAEGRQQLALLVEMEPDHPDVLVLRAQVKRQDGDMEGAYELYLRAYELYPRRGFVHQLANHESMMGNLDAAISRLENWLVAHPSDLGASMAVAALYAKNGREDKAVAKLEGMLQERPDNAIVLNELAWLLRDSEPSRALQYAERASSLLPESPEILDTYAVLLASNAELTKAARIVDRALSKAPDNPSILYHSAMIDEMSGNNTAATEKLKRLLGAEVDFPELKNAQDLLAKLEMASAN